MKADLNTVDPNRLDLNRVDPKLVHEDALENGSYKKRLQIHICSLFSITY